MIDDLLERLFPEPCEELDWMTKGEAYWIRFYLWYTRFCPYRVYWLAEGADFDTAWRHSWMWRGRHLTNRHVGSLL